MIGEEEGIICPRGRPEESIARAEVMFWEFGWGMMRVG